MNRSGSSFDIQEYMTRGVERVMADALKATIRDNKERNYLLRFAAASKAAAKKRAAFGKEGEHVPPLIIASITSSCNLHCAGCYARGINSTCDGEPVSQLTAQEWATVFDEAEQMGVSFIMLVGGEPLLRRDVLAKAGNRPNILFPVFTNGTYIDDDYFRLFDSCRNLVPVISIEGGRDMTDARRGEGIYDLLLSNMDQFRSRNMIFGASVTVTTNNYREVTSDQFLQDLSGKGCRLMVFIEYVPTQEEDACLAPGDPERDYMAAQIERLRREHPEMVYVSFPGDEKASGGCIAAGRGLFHINSHGGAEPCPFSPYSDVNIRNTSLREVLQSPLFAALQHGDLLKDDHKGGCVLYEKRESVEALASRTSSL